MKSLFFVSSAISPSYGCFTREQRYQQTLLTIQSIRKRAPDSHIILVDVSVNEFPQSDKDALRNSVEYFIDLSDYQQLINLSKNRLQSRAETLMTLITFQTLQENNVFKQYDRIFKITGRLQLDTNFDLNQYSDKQGKYVFAKKIPTWMSIPYQNANYLYITRLYSLCSSLITTHIDVLKKMWNYFDHVDFEHAMFASVPNELVIEFDRVHCVGHIASSGELSYD